MAFLYYNGVNLGPVIDAKEFPKYRRFEDSENTNAIYRIRHNGYMFDDPINGTYGLGTYGLCKFWNEIIHEWELPELDTMGLTYRMISKPTIPYNRLLQMMQNLEPIEGLIPTGQEGPAGDIAQIDFAYYFNPASEGCEYKRIHDISELETEESLYGLFVRDRSSLRYGKWIKLNQIGDIVCEHDLTTSRGENDIIKIVREGASLELPEGQTSANHLGLYHAIPIIEDGVEYKPTVYEDKIRWDSGDYTKYPILKNFEDLAYLLYYNHYSLIDGIEPWEDGSSDFENLFMYCYNDNIGRVQATKETLLNNIGRKSVVDIMTNNHNNGFMSILPKPMKGATNVKNGEAGYVPAPGGGNEQKVLSAKGNWTVPFLGMRTETGVDIDSDESLRFVPDDVKDISSGYSNTAKMSKMYCFPVKTSDESEIGYVEQQCYYDGVEKTIIIKETFNVTYPIEGTEDVFVDAKVRFGYLKDWDTNYPSNYSAYTWFDWRPLYPIEHIDLTKEEYATMKAAGSLMNDVTYFVHP